MKGTLNPDWERWAEGMRRMWWKGLSIAQAETPKPVLQDLQATIDE